MLCSQVPFGDPATRAIENAHTHFGCRAKQGLYSVEGELQQLLWAGLWVRSEKRKLSRAAWNTPHINQGTVCPFSPGTIKLLYNSRLEGLRTYRTKALASEFYSRTWEKWPIQLTRQSCKDEKYFSTVIHTALYYRKNSGYSNISLVPGGLKRASLPLNYKVYKVLQRIGLQSRSATASLLIKSN
jgi:hypothetical protein